jgi:hypothetical protein
MRILNRLLALPLALSLTTALLSGCGEIKVRAGSPVAPSLLESRLTVGQSTAKDISQVLGEPLGVGREFLPFHTQPRTVWSYYFEEDQVSLGGGGDSRRIFVWVFLTDERYDGYLWVSSFPKDRVTP